MDRVPVSDADDALAALRAAVGTAVATIGGQPFGVYLDDRGARGILEHVAQQEARIASLSILLDHRTDERDRARALVIALTSEQEEPD